MIGHKVAVILTAILLARNTLAQPSTPGQCPSVMPQSPNLFENPSFEQGVAVPSSDGSSPPTFQPDNWKKGYDSSFYDQRTLSAPAGASLASDGNIFGKLIQVDRGNGDAFYYQPSTVKTQNGGRYLVSFWAAIGYGSSEVQVNVFELWSEESTPFFTLDGPGLPVGSSGPMVYKQYCVELDPAMGGQRDQFGIQLYRNGDGTYIHLDSVALQDLDASPPDPVTVSATATITETLPTTTSTPQLSVTATVTRTTTKVTKTTTTPATKTISQTDAACTDVYAAFPYKCCPTSVLMLDTSSSSKRSLFGEHNVFARAALFERDAALTTTTFVTTTTTTLPAATVTAQTNTKTVSTTYTTELTSKTSIIKAATPTTVKQVCQRINVDPYVCPTNIPSAQERKRLKMQYLDSNKAKASSGRPLHVRCSGKNYIY